MRRQGVSKDYVTDGLILHLDAIKNGSGGTHSNSTTTWYDLSPSGNNVSLINPSWSDTYLTFTGSTRGQTGSNLNLSGKNKCTIEVLLRTISASVGIIMEHTTNYNNNGGAFICVINDSSLNIYSALRKTGSGNYLAAGFNTAIDNDLYTFQYDDTTNVASTENEQFLNTIKKTLTILPGNCNVTTDTNLISSILYIGARSGGVAPFSGSIRAIRVYNRKLSVAELYQNKITDFRRYGIIK